MLLLVFLSLTTYPVSGTLCRQSLAVYPLAVCNDGQPATFYYDGPARATEYMIDLQGGGLCHTIQECKRRCEDTSKPFYRLCHPRNSPNTTQHGMLSTNSTINPNFHNYHKTFVPYCSSDFHSGNKSASQETGGYHFRGKEIFVAVVDFLKSHTNVAQATTVILTGGSAGGFGVLANCDFLRTLLPDVHDVRCVIDTTGFIPLTLKEGCPNQDIFFDYIPAFWGGIPNDLCSESTVSQTRINNCYHLDHALAFIRSPLFVMSNIFDRVFMQRVCEYKLKEDTRNYFRQWGRAMKERAETFQTKYTRWGLFMPSCYDHGIYKKKHVFSKLLVGENSMSISQALHNWMNHTGSYVTWDKCEEMSKPCNAYCENSISPPVGLMDGQTGTKRDLKLFLITLFVAVSW